MKQGCTLIVSAAYLLNRTLATKQIVFAVPQKHIILDIKSKGTKDHDS